MSPNNEATERTDFVEATWTSPDGMTRLFLADCLDVLPQLRGVDAVVTDPPYGMNWNTDSTRFTGGQHKRGDGREDWGHVAADDTPFEPEPWLAFPKVILWGSNHFAQRVPVGTTLVWIKKADHLFGTFLSDCEVAWMKGGHGVYAYRQQFPPPSRMAENDGECAHPCQKPIDLMLWCIDKTKTPPDATILDPFMGSGTTGVACARIGKRFIGIEKDPVHFETAKRRIQESMRMEVPQPDGSVQKRLFGIETNGVLP